MSNAIVTEVWERAQVSGNTLLTLLRLADSAGDDHRMCWESVATLARRTRQGKRTTYRALERLTEHGYIEVVPEDEIPPGSRRYPSVVRRIRPAAQWPTGPAAETNDNTETSMQGPQETQESSMAAILTPCQEIPKPPMAASLTPCQKNQEPPMTAILTPDYKPKPLATETQVSETSFQTPSASRPARRGGTGKTDTAEAVAAGWGAVPDRSPRRVSRRRAAEQAQADEDALDPARAVAADLEDPAPEPTSGPWGRPSPAGKPKARSLAEYFAREGRGHIDTKIHPDPVNFAALEKTFRQWMASGVGPDQIAEAIRRYWSPTFGRRPDKVPWTDFVAARSALLARGQEPKIGKLEASRGDDSRWA